MFRSLTHKGSGAVMYYVGVQGRHPSSSLLRAAGQAASGACTVARRNIISLLRPAGCPCCVCCTVLLLYKISFVKHPTLRYALRMIRSRPPRPHLLTPAAPRIVELSGGSGARGAPLHPSYLITRFFLRPGRREVRAVGRSRWLSKIAFTKLDLSQTGTGKVGRVRSTTTSKRRMLATVLPRLTRLPYASASHIPNPLRTVTARLARNRLRMWEKMAGPATDFRCGPLVPLGRFALSPSLNVDQAFCGIEGKATRPTSRVLPEPSSHSSCLEPSTNYTFLAAHTLSLLPYPPPDLPCVPILWLIPATTVPPSSFSGHLSRHRHAGGDLV